MSRTRQLVMALTTLMLIGCSLTQFFASPSNQAFDMTATAIIATNHWVETALAQTQIAATSTGNPVATIVPCYFNWATQDLPELTAEIQSAIDDIGLENVAVVASAYGENCYAIDTNEVRHFAAMETDFSITVEVDNLEDEEALGNLTAQILTVLDQIPPEDIPGPQPGYISLTFVAGDVQRNLRFTATQADAALEQGLTGAALFQVLKAQQ